MLFKKDVEAIKDVITEFENKLDNIEMELSTIKDVQSLHSRELASHGALLEQSNKKQTNELKDALISIGLVQEEFEKTVRRFTDLGRRMETYVYETLGATIKESVSKITEDTKNYSNVKTNVARTIQDMKDLSKQVEKFRAIAEHLKTSDFAMAEYAKELTRSDQEKLRLMKQIDNLERLVASLRKKQRPY